MGILGNISVNSKSVKIAIVALYKLIACHSGLVEFTRLLKSCKAKVLLKENDIRYIWN